MPGGLDHNNDGMLDFVQFIRLLTVVRMTPYLTITHFQRMVLRLSPTRNWSSQAPCKYILPDEYQGTAMTHRLFADIDYSATKQVNHSLSTSIPAF